MKVMAEVRAWHLVVAAEPHSGWLPAGAATPPPTPRREYTLNVRIEYDEDEGGYFLFWESPDGLDYGDTWHLSLADAKAQAEYSLGIPHSAWQTPK